MTEEELRQHRCCFTGHRPEKLAWSEDHAIAALDEKIRQAIADGYTTFISGMARGVDIWAAEIVLRLRDEGLPLHLICAVPYPGFQERWILPWQRRYNKILENADLVKCVSNAYDPGCFQRRNEWMIDRSTRVIAIYTGEPGGTKNTIDYALREGIEVVYGELHTLRLMDRQEGYTAARRIFGVIFVFGNTAIIKQTKV